MLGWDEGTVLSQESSLSTKVGQAIKNIILKLMPGGISVNFTLKEGETVNLVYFSGTGCAAKVADVFEKSLLAKNIQVKKTELRWGQTQLMSDNDDLLMLLYAVHACTRRSLSTSGLIKHL